jgi:hypothetical protein
MGHVMLYCYYMHALYVLREAQADDAASSELASLRVELFNAAARHRVALTQRAAVDGLPRGTSQRDVLQKQQAALLALRSQVDASDEEPVPANVAEAALGPLLKSIILEPISNKRADDWAAPPQSLWEVSAALQSALLDETLYAVSAGTAGAADPTSASATAPAAAEEAAPASAANAAAGDETPARQALRSVRAQLAAARRELIARLCCRLQRGWDELDSIDTRLIVLVTGQAAQVPRFACPRLQILHAAPRPSQKPSSARSLPACRRAPLRA